MLTRAEQKLIERKKKIIERYNELKPNWDSYGGKPTTKAAIKRAMRLVEEIDPYTLKYIDIAPTNDGGVQFERYILQVIVTTKVRPNGGLYVEIDDSEEPYVEV